MNILFICPNSPKISVGGVERYITNLINYYKAKEGNVTHLILPAYDNSYTENIGNITVHHQSYLTIPKDHSHHRKEIIQKANDFLLAVTTLITTNKIDIICAENLIFGPPAIYALFLNMIASTHDIPLVLRLHSFPDSVLQIELVNQLMWNKVICVSRSVAGDCFQKGANIDTLTTHYLGVDTNIFNDRHQPSLSLKTQLSLPYESKIILTATRIINGTKNIIKEKGIINLIKAFSKISPRFTDTILLIAVGIPPRSLNHEFSESLEMLNGYLKLHQIAQRTIVKTFSLDEMATVYRESDMFVLTSENETFGQVFIEAMGCGLPVIGTKVGGIPEIISDSYNGYLVQPDDASVLAQRIEKLLTDKQTAAKFIKAGQKTVISKFEAQTQFTEFHSLLNQLVIENQ